MSERLRQRNIAMIALGLGVTAYELACKNDETISEFLDPHMEKRWKQLLFVTGGAIALAHMANLVPEDKDPFEKTLSPLRQAFQRRVM